jgi:hypothetical protein
VAIPSSVSISGSKFVWFWLSWADAARVKDSAQGRDEYKYVNPASKVTIWEHSAQELLPVAAGGIPGSGGVGSLCLLGRGTPVPVRLQRVSGFFAVPFWQGG